MKYLNIKVRIDVHELDITKDSKDRDAVLVKPIFSERFVEERVPVDTLPDNIMDLIAPLLKDKALPHLEGALGEAINKGPMKHLRKAVK